MTNNATVAVRTQDTDEQQAPSKWKSIARQFGVVWSNSKARIGIIILAVFVLVAIFAPLLAPYGASQNGFARSADATADHWMGTTAAGEDVLSQIIYGARISVMVGAVAGILSTLVAVAIGLSWGYVRGWIGEVIGFIVNLFLVIPGLPLMIVIAAYLQNGGIAVIIAVIVVTGWAWGARVLRSQTQSLRGRDFVTAAQFSGDGATRIVFREILPNMTSLIVGSFFGAATSAILAEAGLEFLGLGDSSIVSWGTILYWAQNSNALLTGQWILLFAPGLCIALLAMSLTLINFGVDAVSNPRLREGARPKRKEATA
ncbi:MULTISPECIES: ABC transporter permease [unclassified Curtobacterium]|uniref:ABC transporter permease n=1 Tax=Bacteria TaxID=2 RepID=UPI000F46BE1B|nr:MULTISPECIES: ABC transporter permease [unclassified Curtobacterium]NQW91495.1 ABC transporter permease [Curtobacterium sp. VKM Ac-2861]MBF4587091.1 ABC transporter permease [Curtobacterium sp. VKM Ac-2887]MBF4605091.1 ABC transporter permease [Curtobacterium sp. VKM Ac-2884]ROQ17742.1 peptide/nickel transport system permease protein [Curtobacterium sp. PhB171]ROQ29013.1 peptide/nickel transport system permease protein [Curtobacterium sp. PhB170]